MLQVQDPISRYVREPIARRIAPALGKVGISAERATFVHPILAAIAGHAVVTADARNIVLAVALFELRSLLSGVAAAQGGERSSGMADRIGALAFLIGVAWHLHLHLPIAGWSSYLVTHAVVLVAVAQVIAASAVFVQDFRRLAAALGRGQAEAARSQGAPSRSTVA